MADHHLLTERDGGVFALRFNRPERLNAMTMEMLEQAISAVDEATACGARALLVTGTGRGFSVGADLQRDAALGGADMGVGLEKVLNPLMMRLAAAPFPIVSAVNGPAVGAGVSLAIGGDFAVMARSAYLLIAFANVGLVPDGGLTYLLPRLVGRQRAVEAMMLGERISAETCVGWGLAYKAVDDERLMDEAMGLAQRLASGPTKAYALMRRNLRLGLDASFADVLLFEREAQREASATEDFREGVRAFGERRRPVFKGC
jgi:2-(1,2-epoxy-1,2-dihydrophenyl)acetyl-CoA isomerase